MKVDHADGDTHRIAVAVFRRENSNKAFSFSKLHQDTLYSRARVHRMLSVNVYVPVLHPRGQVSPVSPQVLSCYNTMWVKAAYVFRTRFTS